MEARAHRAVPLHYAGLSRTILSSVKAPLTLQPLTLEIDIWLKWWTEANHDHADASTAMYYGVYSALLCVWIAFVGIDCW